MPAELAKNNGMLAVRERYLPLVDRACLAPAPNKRSELGGQCGHQADTRGFSTLAETRLAGAWLRTLMKALSP